METLELPLNPPLPPPLWRFLTYKMSNVWVLLVNTWCVVPANLLIGIIPYRCVHTVCKYACHDVCSMAHHVYPTKELKPQNKLLVGLYPACAPWKVISCQITMYWGCNHILYRTNSAIFIDFTNRLSQSIAGRNCTVIIMTVCIMSLGQFWRSHIPTGYVVETR